MEKQVVRLSDVLPYQEFAKVIGKTPEAVKGMIDKNKLPVVEMRTPETPTARAEYWVYLPAWNEGMKLAFESRPKEIRDGWLQWLGLGEPSSPVR
ncbi:MULTISPECIES: Cox family DNA-binding protein [unclassified Serratia (in: enterobacteria)]|uniref:Cox family DNA-binding protein n=1 Tax=unclassified Serratia (in: enterobacteria) TaxID=2647522 RepID=UPI000469D4D4|nr:MULTISPECIES: Cox family DNA-binding protein [unclassified Serratia (in: enterobacteria)]